MITYGGTGSNTIAMLLARENHRKNTMINGVNGPKNYKVTAKCEDKQYKFPVILYYEDPDSRDPRGTSLWDIIADDQKLETLLMNLFKINIIRNAL